MKVKWKTFRASFPYICNDCGEFSFLQREYCEACGNKNTLRKTEIDDYEKKIVSSKLDDIPNRSKKHLHEKKKIILDKKKKEGIYIIVIACFAILIINIVAFFIILNNFNIPIEEIGDNLWVLFNLLGFSIVVLLAVLITVYYTCFHVRYLWWLTP